MTASLPITNNGNLLFRVINVVVFFCILSHSRADHLFVSGFRPFILLSLVMNKIPDEYFYEAYIYKENRSVS